MWPEHLNGTDYSLCIRPLQLNVIPISMGSDPGGEGGGGGGGGGGGSSVFRGRIRSLSTDFWPKKHPYFNKTADFYH